MTIEEASDLIKKKCLELGFSACGIARAEAVDQNAVREHEDWLQKGYAADMDYLHRNKAMRYDPRLLEPGAKSLICVAMNYYPKQFVESDVSFACYSYGKDYHYVLKSYLSLLLKFIKEELSPELGLQKEVGGRAFADSAPLMERYWAKKCGLGFQGRNSLIIVPKVGSFCFLGVLAVDIELAYDTPIHISCGNCHRCEEACPTHAICNGVVDANKCISYQTIENKSVEIPADISLKMGKRIYGCDACQKACPWNRFAVPTSFEEFSPSEDFLNISSQTIKNMSNGEFKRVFKNSAVSRAGLKGLKRNVSSVDDCNAEIAE